MNKILVIGQAPPAVKQQYPYDTTMLYDMLSWVGITKQEAQNIFEFEAVCNTFPGFGTNGHNIPSIEQMNQHWFETLENKVELADKIWILGNVAKEYFNNKEKTLSCNIEVLETIHPSKRNYLRIMKDKEIITRQLKSFLF